MEWIRVEDRLPEVNCGEYIVMCHDGEVTSAFFRRYNDPWPPTWNIHCFDIPVTHWMPLPAPPEE